jgi:hypothetical protein
MLITEMQGAWWTLTTFDLGSIIAGALLGVVGMIAAIHYCVTGWLRAERERVGTERRLFAARTYINFIQADADLGASRREAWQRHRAKARGK